MKIRSWGGGGGVPAPPGPAPGSATDTVDTSGKNAPKLIKLPSLKVIRLKQTKIQLRKVSKLYRRLYGGGGRVDLATLMLLAVNSWSHDLPSKSHGESENRKFTRQFQ